MDAEKAQIPRWENRFESYGRARALLESVLDSKPAAEFSVSEEAGLVQFFEITFELAWKTMKDYIEQGGISLPIASPKKVLKQAYQMGIIEDGELWLDMLEKRNLMSHTYQLEAFDAAVNAIANKYRGAFTALKNFFESEVQAGS